jgi:hypothetical protein
MSVVGNLSRHEHFAEFNVGLETNHGYMSPAARKAAALANLGIAGSTVASGTQAAAITKPTGGTTTDAEARAAIDAIIDALAAFGITA